MCVCVCEGGSCHVRIKRGGGGGGVENHKLYGFL